MSERSLGLNSGYMESLLAQAKLDIGKTISGRNTIVRAASTGNLTLSGLQTVDGVTLVAGNSILVKDQTDTTQNGPWMVSATAWSRLPYSLADNPIGASVSITEGANFAGSVWVSTTPAPTSFVQGTSPLTYLRVGGRTGLVRVATTLSNITLSGLQTIDGVTLLDGDTVLVKDQTDLTQNGIWAVSAAAWSRSASAYPPGALVTVTEGTTSTGTVWSLNTPTPKTYVAGTSQTTFRNVGGYTSNVSMRQAVQTALLDANGYNNAISAGTGLAVNLAATAAPYVLAFATGFGAVGNQDYVSSIKADVASWIAGLNPLNINYLYADYLTSSSVTPGKTLAPPQTGGAYDRTRQSLLQFGGAAGATAILEDFGNVVTVAGGARIQTNNFKFGTGGLGGGGTNNILNGSTDYIRIPSITTFGQNSWAVRGWFYQTAWNTNTSLFSLDNGSGYGARLEMNGSTGKLQVALSSTGSSFDIANFTASTATLALNTWYYVELVFDSLAGKYIVYINGVADMIVTSALKLCSTASGVYFGAYGPLSASRFYFGYMDKLEILPYCDHPNGVTYVVPTAAPNVAAVGYASDFFSSTDMKMYGVTGVSTAPNTNPVLTAKNRLYVCEATTSASAVTGVVNYAIRGRYESPLTTFVLTGVYTNSHNLGYTPKKQRTVLVNVIADIGYVPGDEVDGFGINSSASNSVGFSVSSNSKTVTVSVAGASVNLVQKSGNSVQNITPANWKLKTYIEGY